MPIKQRKSTRATTIRTGPGEYADSMGNVAMDEIGQIFLDYASEIEPTFVTDITVNAEPIFALLQSGRFNGLALQKVIEILGQWRTKHRLSAPWAESAGLYTILVASRRYMAGESLPTTVLWPDFEDNATYQLLNASKGARPPRLPWMAIGIQISDLWRIDLETRADVRTRLLAEAERQIDKQLDHWVGLLDQLPSLRRPVERNQDRYEWLARYLIGRQAILAISGNALQGTGADFKKITNNRSNIYKGIEDAARDLEITLPPDWRKSANRTRPR